MAAAVNPMKAPLCYVWIEGNAPGKRIGLVRFNELGYYQTDADTPETSKETGQRIVALLNDRLGINAEVQEAMFAGSMFGWGCPAAEPARRYAQENAR